MHFPDTGNLGSNHMRVFLSSTLTETSFLTTSYYFEFFFLLVCKLYKSGLSIIHYILKASRYTNIVYSGRYLILTYIEILFSTVCSYFSYISLLVNCISWVSKFNNFFQTCMETEARFIFEGFNIVLYGKFISNHPILFFLFLYGP